MFRRREGPASQSLPGTPPSFSLACPLVTYEAFPCQVDSLPPTPLWYGSASPSSLPTSSLLQASMRSGYVFQGVRTCFPGAIDTEFGHRNSFVFLTESLIHGESTVASGRVFPDAIEYQFDLAGSKARTATLRKPVQISDRALALSEVVWSRGIVYGVARSD